MNDPFDFFDAIFCINLDSRPDRWQQCASHLQERELLHKVQRFPATSLQHPSLSSKFLARAGCSYSHFSVAKKAQEEGYNNYLLLEDDCVFAYDQEALKKKLSSCLEQLPENWDLFYLGGNLDSSYGIYPIDNFSDSLLKLNSAHCCHAMAFNKGFINTFANEGPSKDLLFDWVEKYICSDVYLAQHVLANINAFIADPLLAFQRESFSNIEGSVYDYSNWMMQNFQIFKNNLKSQKHE